MNGPQLSISHEVRTAVTQRTDLGIAFPNGVGKVMPFLQKEKRDHEKL